MDNPPFKITAWPFLNVHSENKLKNIDFLWPFFHFRKKDSSTNFSLRPFIFHLSKNISNFTLYILLFLLYISFSKNTIRLCILFGWILYFQTSRNILSNSHSQNQSQNQSQNRNQFILTNYYYHIFPLALGFKNDHTVFHFSPFMILISKQFWYFKCYLFFIHIYHNLKKDIYFIFFFIYKYIEEKDDIIQELSFFWILFKIYVKKTKQVVTMRKLHILWPFFQIEIGQKYFRISLFPFFSLLISEHATSLSFFFHLFGWRKDLKNAIKKIRIKMIPFFVIQKIEMQINWNNTGDNKKDTQIDITYKIFFLGSYIHWNRNYRLLIWILPFLFIERNFIGSMFETTMILPFYFKHTENSYKTQWILGYFRYETVNKVINTFLFIYLFIGDKSSNHTGSENTNSKKSIFSIFSIFSNYRLFILPLLLYIRSGEKDKIKLFYIMNPLYTKYKWLNTSTFYFFGTVGILNHGANLKYIYISTLLIKYHNNTLTSIFGNPIPFLPWLEYEKTDNTFKIGIFLITRYLKKNNFQTFYIFPILYLNSNAYRSYLISPLLIYYRKNDEKRLLMSIFFILYKYKFDTYFITILGAYFEDPGKSSIFSLLFIYSVGKSKLKLYIFPFIYLNTDFYSYYIYIPFVFSMWKFGNYIFYWDLIPIPIFGRIFRYSKCCYMDQRYYETKIHMWPLFSYVRIKFIKYPKIKNVLENIYDELNIFFILRRNGLICCTYCYIRKELNLSIFPLIYLKIHNSWKNLIFINEDLKYILEISILFFLHPNLSLFRYKKVCNYSNKSLAYHLSMLFLFKFRKNRTFEKTFGVDSTNYNNSLFLPKYISTTISFGWILQSKISLIRIVWEKNSKISAKRFFTLSFAILFAIAFIENPNYKIFKFSALWFNKHSYSLINFQILNGINFLFRCRIIPLFACKIDNIDIKIKIFTIYESFYSLGLIKIPRGNPWQIKVNFIFLFYLDIENHRTSLKIINFRSFAYIEYQKITDSTFIRWLNIFYYSKVLNEITLSILYLSSGYHNTSLFRLKYGRRPNHRSGDNNQLRVSMLFLFNFTYRKEQIIRLTLFWILYHHLSIIRFTKELNPNGIKIGIFPIFRFDRKAGRYSKWCLFPIIPVKYTFLFNFCAYEKHVFSLGNIQNGVENKKERNQSRIFRFLYKVAYINMSNEKKQIELNPLLYYEKSSSFTILNLFGGFCGLERNRTRKNTRRRVCCLFYF